MRLWQAAAPAAVAAPAEAAATIGAAEVAEEDDQVAHAIRTVLLTPFLHTVFVMFHSVSTYVFRDPKLVLFPV